MLEVFENVSRAVADPSRIRILKLLERGELCVCEIVAVIDLAPATISKHLSVLKAAGLVQQRREGRWIHYRLAERTLNAYAQPFLALAAASLRDDPTVRGDAERLARVSTMDLKAVCELGREALEPAGAGDQAPEGEG